MRSEIVIDLPFANLTKSLLNRKIRKYLPNSRKKNIFLGGGCKNRRYYI